MSTVLWPRMTHRCQCYLKTHVVGEGPGATLSLRHRLFLINSLLIVYNVLLKASRGHSFCLLLMSMSEAFSISLYFNKSLLHKSSEQSTLISGPRLNFPSPEAKNPSIFHGSASTFQNQAQHSLKPKPNSEQTPNNSVL